ncbi:probable serine/threonine-protein kinase ndrD isoform X2 [Eurosta solidaginis]|uniref:probable serine/threonine-protein kinase ndrD isoform X2 n=1 Tax=Eurosta solidaginis TaxID=178769 RepID=UPI0035315A1E
MPNNRRHLQQKQNCQRHNQLTQQPLLYNKCLKHYGNYRLQLVTAISIILFNIIAEHNVNATIATKTATAQMPTANIAITNSHIGSVSNTTSNTEIRSNNHAIENNSNSNNNNAINVAGEIVNENYLSNDNNAVNRSGAQRQQQQHRNEFRAKFSALDKEVDELLENERSFIYGRNPNESPVPIYAVVKLCTDPMEKPLSTTSAIPLTPSTSAPSSQIQLDNLPPSSSENYINSNSINSKINLQISPLPLVTASTISISSTRGSYIPISIDPSDMHIDTIRRSSRLYPVFQRVRRNSQPLASSIPALPVPILLNLPPKELVVHPYADVMLAGESPPNDYDSKYHDAEMPTTDAPTIPTATSDTSGQVNNFIANLADNVKFSMPTGDELLNDYNNDIDSNFEHQGTNFKETKKLKNIGVKKLKNVPSFHVTYWMFYPYSQGKTMCTLSLGPLGSIPFPAVYGFCLGRRKDIGSHIGDWEHMSLYFNGAAEPEAMYVSAHDAGAYYSYNRLTGSFEFKKQETRKGILQRPNFPKTVTTFNNHPVLFAAKGSHGLWTAPGKHRFVKVARLYDINGFGTPWNTWKSVDITYENFKSYGRSLVPSWLSFKGKWGNPKSKCHPFRRIGLNFCEYTDGPTGIPLKEPHFQCNTASFST